MIYVVVEEALIKKYENCESLRKPRVHDSRQTLLCNSSIIRIQRFNYANYLDKGGLCDIQVASRLNLHDHTSGMESLLPRQRTKVSLRAASWWMRRRKQGVKFRQKCIKMLLISFLIFLSPLHFISKASLEKYHFEPLRSVAVSAERVSTDE